VIVRARTIYQLALETGRSAEEMSDPAAAREIASLWRFVEGELTAAGAEAAST
jgi:chromosome partitioning protein